MSREVASDIGSGTIPYTRAILSPAQRGSTSGAGGTRTGIQVMVGNPEDMVAVDAFASSGIAVGTAPIKIFGSSQSPLPRARKVVVENASDSSTLLISHAASKVVSEGFQLTNAGAGTPRASVELPILGGTDVWAAALSGTVQVRILIF
jgi:hypothetical protein